MFTGIITDIGTVRSIEPSGDTRVRIVTGYDTTHVDIGASICCGGVCLTVVDKGADWFAVDVSAETLSKSAFSSLNVGTRLNLERALKVGDELGGHIVSGHVDCTGEIVSIASEGASRRFVIRAPKAIAGFIAPKGSICVNGTSLTVNAVTDHETSCDFGINIIPHTLEWTTFDTAVAGDIVNLEIDTLARYVARLKEIQS